MGIGNSLIYNLGAQGEIYSSWAFSISNKKIKIPEFDLSMKEVNDFIDWYEAKQAGSGKASYAMNKHDNKKGPLSRKDYILFDRVLTFEVSEY